jgi:hypothetical protein
MLSFKTLRRALLVTALAWTVALPMAAFGAAIESHGSSLREQLVILIYAAGSMICHQRPERSFHLFGVQMAVCARCVGAYAGASTVAVLLMGASFATVRGAPRSLTAAGTPRPPLFGVYAPRNGSGLSLVLTRAFGLAWAAGAAPWRARSILVASAVPAAVTIAYEWAMGVTPSNWVRAASGLPLGGAIAWIVYAMTRRPGGHVG